MVAVDWYDAYSIDPWNKFEAIMDDLRTPVLCHTVGYVVADFETSLSVCHTFNEEGQVCGVMQIPRCSIKEVKQL